MRRGTALAIGLVVTTLLSTPAGAQTGGCKRAVIFTLPATSWEMVGEFEPPNLLRIMEEGATGAMSVRTNSSRTSYASGFATIGAGTRVDGGATAGAIAHEEASETDATEPGSGSTFDTNVPVGGVPEIVEGIDEADYTATPGALAGAIEAPVIAIGNADAGAPPPTPEGWGRWVLLAAMDPTGVVDAAAVEGGETPLLVDDPDAPFGVRTDNSAAFARIDEALEDPCASIVIDQGDLIRADTSGLVLEEPGIEIMEDALLAADDLLGLVDAALDDDDLLLVVSPTSPWWDGEVHLGVAVAKGPGFSAGHTLRSASTRQDGLVTLPDVAPTVLAYLGIERPASMLGRTYVPVERDGGLLDEMVFLDKESVFAHGHQAGISTAFVVIQIVIYAIAILLLSRRERKPPPDRREFLVRWLRRASLGIVAFPFATYLATPFPAHELGTVAFIATLIAIDVAVVVVVSLLLSDPLERLLAITGSTILLFIVDLSLLKMLQLNAVWGNDPIVAGRFTGLGNIAFAILGSSSLMTGALLVHRYPDRRGVFVAVAALFAVTVFVDGAPGLGSDVGGVLALVPALGLTFILLLGRRPSFRTVLVAGLGALLALGLFLAIDLARPPENRTHLGRLVEDIEARGFDAFNEAVGRKIRTNLRVFRSTIWTYLVPFALGIIAWLVLRPTGRWRELAERYPKLRAGLIGGLILGVLGFAVNDSGIVVPAMVLSFLAPMSLLLHVVIERDLTLGDRR